MKSIVFGAAALVIGVSLLWIGIIKTSSLATRMHSLKQVPLLKSGMAEPEVWRVLGLEEYRLHVNERATGTHTDSIMYCPVTHDKMIITHWDRTKNPPILNEAHIEWNSTGHTMGEDRY